jgi:hypothetical protein
MNHIYIYVVTALKDVFFDSIFLIIIVILNLCEKMKSSFENFSALFFSSLAMVLQPGLMSSNLCTLNMNTT